MSTSNLFSTSKYTKWYYQIINKAQSEKRIKNQRIYYESHHIIPKSLGGNNNKENRILLTFKEHYICHRLLCYMVFNNILKNKMYYALYNLSRSSNSQDRNLPFHHKLICLEANRIASSKRLHKPHLGHKHSEKTKDLLRKKSLGYKHTKESKQKISLSNKKTAKSRAKKVSDFWKNREKSETHKKNLSESVKKYWIKKKMVEAQGIEP